jgi:hypothetical protein
LCRAPQWYTKSIESCFHLQNPYHSRHPQFPHEPDFERYSWDQPPRCNYHRATNIQSTHLRCLRLRRKRKKWDS